MNFCQKRFTEILDLRILKKRLDILYPKQHKFKVTDSEDIFLVTLELNA